ncbi:acyl-CoA dehydrogenase domain protein [Parvibaculum lavamentivorans DS-1]|uniref:Acyl-CoA dehydrogenase domain protein n=1 Tax=Parvibaculum lavamentivorans (strain DS-1 / DSM 13023 / NCIMB 13966) TaxID=402881 RepID=A7HV85_PARL1|nr:acyl-CoA dehydrogenase family protein [Parvibaculum lavamentivorans]ABS63818.1 acyl-CoA dehydrogenase domain protein [Parvibaculum lavamentivorans DS-1]
MALVLTEEQQLLRDTATQFFQERLPIANLRSLRDTKDRTGFDRDAWKEMSDLGFAGIMISEKYGGTDFGPVGLGLVLEQAGRTLAATPLVSTVLLCGSAVQLAGNATQRQDILSAIAAGDRVMALALEEGPHHNPTRIATKAVAEGSSYRISGSKTFVLDGHVADQLIVVARTSGDNNDRSGITLFLVDPKAEGVKITRTLMVDSRNAANIEFNNVAVPDAAVLGSVDGATDVLGQVLDIARIGLSAEMLGLTQEVFDTTLAYLKERKQFGKVIGSFQALQHRMATLFAEIELCRSVVLDALSAIEERRNDVPQIASLAKSRLSDIATLMTNEGLQMHGGMGMTDQFDVGLFMKRARVAAASFGDGNFHRDRYASLEGY